MKKQSYLKYVFSLSNKVFSDSVNTVFVVHVNLLHCLCLLLDVFAHFILCVGSSSFL
jgi:hypothetical protein